MPALHARPVRLTASQRHQLKKIARGHKSPHRDKLRAQIVLDAAAGHTNAAMRHGAATLALAAHVELKTVQDIRTAIA
jgi:type IV pilus biogenesis protein CpaD/CtpE